ncbi:MAG: hypothetical protein JNK48_22740 [Bryobacterales bacterium]|nr:hypothetical protein [Bryobacterales bacterium]
MAQRYDIRQTYDWNYLHAPASPPAVAVAPCPGQWRFCGIPVASPLGVPAGPLLNSRWILHYAALGFDVLTYKTVRSAYRACYDLPNLLPVERGELREEGHTLHAASGSGEYDSWAISFGMPSRDPVEWRADIGRARQGLHSAQALVVSVVASPQPGWTLQDVANDFAVCARQAADAGAQVVEANLSCPNVCTQEADLFLSPEAARLVASTVRAAMPDLPLALKVGLFPGRTCMEDVVAAVAPFADAICATNSITAKVAGEDGLLFGGLRRGIGGRAIAARCLEETALLRRVLDAQGSPMDLISVGGVATAQDVRDRLHAGATHVQIATAAMIDPMVAIRIREESI